MGTQDTMNWRTRMARCQAVLSAEDESAIAMLNVTIETPSLQRIE